MLNLEEGGQMDKFLNHMLDGTQLAYQALTLLINISVTSIIALKTWCVLVNSVFGKQFIDCALADATRAYMQEVPQVADGKRDRCPNP